jgi:hypothetical protein
MARGLCPGRRVGLGFPGLALGRGLRLGSDQVGLMAEPAKSRFFLSLAAESIRLAENASQPSIKVLHISEAQRWLSLADLTRDPPTKKPRRSGAKVS